MRAWTAAWSRAAAGRRAPATPVGARYSPNSSRSTPDPTLAGRDPGAGAGDRGLHEVAAFARLAQFGERRRTRGARVAAGAVRLQALDLLGLGPAAHREEAAVGAGRERRRRAVGEAVDADHRLRAGRDRREARGIGLDQALLEVAALDRGERAAQRLDPRELVARLGTQLRDLRLDHRRAVEQVLVLEQVGLAGQDLL